MTRIENKSSSDEKKYQNTFDIAESIDELETTSTPSGMRSAMIKIKLLRIRNKVVISRTIYLLLNVIAVGYFAWATYHYTKSKNQYEVSNARQVNNNQTESETCGIVYCGIQWCDGYGMLLILFIVTYFGLFYYLMKRMWRRQIQDLFKPLVKGISRTFSYRLSKIGLIAVALAAFAVFLGFDTINSRERLQSLSGIGVLLGIGFIFSTHPKQIKLRPIICGFTIQVLLGIFCIRWEVGRNIFKCFGDKVSTFLNYANSGSSFVYGELLTDTLSIFAFAILSIVFFVSFIISILYYLGVMQWIVLKLGWVLQTLIGTTACESLTCGANIFLGMSESPLLIRPYIKHLTHSEIHVVMSSGFSTVSGSVLAAYINYGAEPGHLVTSTVMAAPAALCFCKLFYPETEESQTKAGNLQLEKSTDSSILDAAANGAINAIQLVLGIIANIVAFVGFIAFLNGIFSWLGILVGYDGITFEWLFSKLFIPLAWIIGIEWNDCENVAKLIATKTIINEFVAYERLGKMKAAQEISLRSAAIATFAVCGFANPSSLGIMIGSLSAMCPEKRPAITSVAIRAFISGSIICFINACIAGLLMTSDNFDTLQNVNSTIDMNYL